MVIKVIKESPVAISTVSISNTPQANNDAYVYTSPSGKNLGKAAVVLGAKYAF